jgi:hypothetical protein
MGEGGHVSVATESVVWGDELKDSSSRTRFPGRAGDPERQHHAAVMTTTIAHASPSRVSDQK